MGKNAGKMTEKWSKTDELVRADKIYRQRKILRDAKFRWGRQVEPPDTRVRFGASFVNGKFTGC